MSRYFVLDISRSPFRLQIPPPNYSAIRLVPTCAKFTLPISTTFSDRSYFVSYQVALMHRIRPRLFLSPATSFMIVSVAHLESVCDPIIRESVQVLSL